MTEKFLNRVSERDYDGSKIDPKVLANLKDVINNAPTSTNAQQFSAIVITDQEMLDFISENNWKQPHIQSAQAMVLFVADFTRNKAIIAEENIKWNKMIAGHEFARGIIDATIASTYAHDWLMTQGLGVCYIGGPLNYAEALHEKLNLPESTMVVVGIVFGKTTKSNPVKPKLDKVFMEKYNTEEAVARTNKYHDETASYWTERGGRPFKNQITALHVDKPGGYRTSFSKGTAYVKAKFKDIVE